MLIAFLKPLYKPDYVKQCESEYGFTLPSGPALELGRKGIQPLEANLDPDAPQWSFETKAEAIVGAGDFVLSASSRNYPFIERTTNLENIEELTFQLAEMQDKLATMQEKLNALSQIDDADDDAIDFTTQNEALMLFVKRSARSHYGGGR